MDRSARSLAVVFTALLAIATGATGAAASRALGVAPAGAVRIVETWTITASRTSVTCSITLTLELPRVVNKPQREEFGTVKEEEARNCRSTVGVGNNDITFLVERNRTWAMQYSSFSGTLPNITAVQVRIPTFRVLSRIDTMGATTGCLWEGLAEITFPAPRAGSMRFLEAGSRLRLVEPPLEAGILGCEREITLRGSGALNLVQTFTLAP